jgi:short-subunit dehydrogenase
MHSPEFVAKKAVNALLKKKAECIPGLLNKFFVSVMPFIPSGFIVWLHRKTMMTEKGKSTI